MFYNRLKPGKSPTALIIGAIFISFYVFVWNIAPCSANASVFSIKFEKKSLPEAIETLANKTQTKITLIGDIESTAINSMKIESQSLPEIIKTILKRYGTDNYAIIYADKGNVIKIRLVASSSSKEYNFYPRPQSDQSIVKGKLTKSDRTDLRNSYLSCLELSKKFKAIQSIAFCSISTGLYGFPFEEAAKIAIDTVNTWFAENPNGLDYVVFNVFKYSEKVIYERLVRS